MPAMETSRKKHRWHAQRLYEFGERRELRVKTHQLAGGRANGSSHVRVQFTGQHVVVFTVKKVRNFSFFISLWIARGQRNCNTHLLAGVIPAEPQPTARVSLWICNTSTFQHRSFPFLLEFFGYLVYLQLVKNNNDYLPGSCCLKALFLQQTEEIVQFRNTSARNTKHALLFSFE